MSYCVLLLARTLRMTPDIARSARLYLDLYFESHSCVTTKMLAPAEGPGLTMVEMLGFAAPNSTYADRFCQVTGIAWTAVSAHVALAAVGE